MSEISLKKTFIINFFGGIATAFGATVGFAIVIWLLTFIFGHLGGLPLIGSFFATIVSETNNALQSRK